MIFNTIIYENRKLFTEEKESGEVNMGDALKIMKRFQGTWRGNVYQVEKDCEFSIWPEEIFWDLDGNRFQVKVIDVCRERREHAEGGTTCFNIMFELLDRTGAVGDVLFRRCEKALAS